MIHKNQIIFGLAHFLKRFISAVRRFNMPLDLVQKALCNDKVHLVVIYNKIYALGCMVSDRRARFFILLFCGNIFDISFIYLMRDQ